MFKKMAREHLCKFLTGDYTTQYDQLQHLISMIERVTVVFSIGLMSLLLF